MAHSTQQEIDFNDLDQKLIGSCHWYELHLMMYATDASVYRNRPKAVVYPKNNKDVSIVLEWCSDRGISVTPRAAGTSLAGQCVSDGVVVDVSRHLNQILDFDPEQKIITVQPGVVRDELNRYLKPHGLFFGPNTSTSSRSTIGGMVGNNSSGTTSIKYGVTRDKVLGVRGYLADGQHVAFLRPGYANEFTPSIIESATIGSQASNAAVSLASKLKELLDAPEVRQEILDHYPKPGIHRRNTGYALDLLASQCNDSVSKPADLDLLPLICGSEGTLMVTTSITISLDELPPEHNALVVLQYNSMEECMLDVVSAMKHDLYTCELIDDVVLDCTAQNTLYSAYRFFVNNAPKAVLFCELRDKTREGLTRQVDKFCNNLKALERAYDVRVLHGDDIDKAIKLRIAGLGLLGAMVGDKKAVACIEDTAVSLEDLPEFIQAFTEIMRKYDQKAVYYAHAGAGELHLRPILNLKEAQGKKDFRDITQAVSTLVKKYRGSLSGEHGDGIVRSEFIKEQIGVENYNRLQQIKGLFDPQGILNPGKIVNPWPMDERFRVDQTKNTSRIETQYDFSAQQGILSLSEQCNGSGDCRNSHEHQGMLCPSYQATKNERDTTRARANVLREVLSSGQTDAERWGSNALSEAFDLCVGCKACHNECPSKVDMATVKSELQFQRRKLGYSKKSDWFFAHNTLFYKHLFRLPFLFRKVLNNHLFAGLIKSFYAIAAERSLPEFPKYSFAQRFARRAKQSGATDVHGSKPTSMVFDGVESQSGEAVNTVESRSGPAVDGGLKQEKLRNNKDQILYLWIDEFSDYLEPEIAQDAYELLRGLGYEVVCITGLNSARALLSKGYLDKAKQLIDHNLAYFEAYFTKGPVLGIEPSALYGIRDEYLRLATDKALAQKWQTKAFIVEEFLAQEARKGNISAEDFTQAPKKLKLHLHCHQKSLGQVKDTFDLLNLPAGYSPTIIPSGCCGMAGSFGFEKDHYTTSMVMAELHVLPAARRAESQTIIVANGTSCRHQILDGAQRKALHPITVLRHALRSVELA